jgi:Zn-finger in ubiquitin-hydrolases and other protein
LTTCTHLEQVRFLELPSEVKGCEECLASGGHWLHLRMCQICGHIGCCDDSPSRHATAHHHTTGHPIIRSAEPEEDWSWCYLDEVIFQIAQP